MKRKRYLVVWAASLSTLLLMTAAMYPVRDRLQQAHAVLLYLLVVLVGSAFGGRALGLALALLGSVAIDYFFQVPYDLLSVATGIDWFVLATFVITAIVAANLLTRAQHAADQARRRTDEVTRLSRLGAELLGSGTAEHSLVAIADKVRETAAATGVVVFRYSEADAKRHLEPLVTRGEDAQLTVALALDAVARGEASHGPPDGVSLIPLRLHGCIVGVLAIARNALAPLDEVSRRILDALGYYAALAVERVTLIAQTEHAEALRETVRAREALLASVSHDLRTPLSTIKVLAQDSVARGDLETAITHAVVIEEQADRLARMVSNLLDLTRLRTNDLPVHCDVNAAEDLIGAVARQVMGILRDHPLVSQVEPAEPVLLGCFNFVQSQRILTNLIENAVRHSPPGAPIQLRACRDHDAIVFAVSDRGPGVPPSERERIFDAFYRGASAAPDVGGVGLGLHIARALAEAQYGSLVVAERPSGGSTFELRLPVHKDGPIDGEDDESED